MDRVMGAVGVRRAGRRGRWLAPLVLAACGSALVAGGCGGGGDLRDAVPPDDPVGMALWIGEGRVVCDLAHALRADDFLHGWTSYDPGRPEAGPAAVTAARARVAACREDVEPGTRVTARLASRGPRGAVVVLRTIAPSGGGATERMRFRRDDGGWFRVG